MSERRDEQTPDRPSGVLPLDYQDGSPNRPHASGWRTPGVSLATKVVALLACVAVPCVGGGGGGADYVVGAMAVLAVAVAAYAHDWRGA